MMRKLCSFLLLISVNPLSYAEPSPPSSLDLESFVHFTLRNKYSSQCLKADGQAISSIACSNTEFPDGSLFWNFSSTSKSPIVPLPTAPLIPGIPPVKEVRQGSIVSEKTSQCIEVAAKEVKLAECAKNKVEQQFIVIDNNSTNGVESLLSKNISFQTQLFVSVSNNQCLALDTKDIKLKVITQECDNGRNKLFVLKNFLVTPYSDSASQNSWDGGSYSGKGRTDGGGGTDGGNGNPGNGVGGSQNCTSTTTWEQVSQPPVTYKNDNSAGGQVFRSFMPDSSVPNYMHQISADVIRTLYLTPCEVPHKDQLSLTIDSNWEAAWGVIGLAGGEGIRLNALFMNAIRGRGLESVSQDVTGVLYHETTHIYQYSNGSVASSAIEGVADAVRILNGYIPLSNRKKGGTWTDSYQTTAFFLVWIHQTKGLPNFLHDFNQQAKPGNNWSWDGAIFNTTGKHVQELWNEYQSSI